MKKLIIIAILVGFIAAQIIHAQGTVYLSNLGQASIGTDPVGSDSWLAADFLTGKNAGGYFLDSVQLAMMDANGNPTGFTAMLYAQNYNNIAAVVPGNSLGTVDGSANPSTVGIYTYTPASNITLSPNTHYFIVLTSGTRVVNGAYDWSITDTPTLSLNGWSGNNSLSYSSDGLSWSFSSGTLAQFAITATAIPEPSSAFSLLLGSGILIYVRRIFHR